MKKYYIHNEADKCYYVRFQVKDTLNDKPGVFMYTTDVQMATFFESIEEAEKELEKKKIPGAKIIEI